MLKFLLMHKGPFGESSNSGSKAEQWLRSVAIAPDRTAKLRKFAWFLVAYTILVVAWGAFVRASFSGDGCGEHWPLCNGTWLPDARKPSTLIEFFHRITSGLMGPMVIALMVMAYKAFPKGHQARKVALGTVFFTVTEALVGAKLVLQGWVAADPSMARALWMSIHLVNTFMLLACLITVAVYASGAEQVKWRSQGPVLLSAIVGLFAMIALGVSGAITALGDMLFPAKSVVDGVVQDLAPTGHFLIQLRVYHPIIATSVGVVMVVLATLVSVWRPDPRVKRLSRFTLMLFLAQMVVGMANVLLLAPVWMQLVHLLLADLLWMSFVMLSVISLGKDLLPVSQAAVEMPHVEPLRGRDAVRAYIALTKPRVISLLLFTTVAAMFIAKGGWPGGWLLIAVTIGGYCAAGSANAINMVYDRDIDVRMERTAKRPTVTAEIPASHALIFAAALAAISFGLLTYAANVLAAIMAMAGLLFYVFIYTMLLKRRTWHNIVIGGAAGAFPPLVGYSAITGQLNPLSWVLFGIIFVWTPVHFWALALVIQDEYKDAGIPMLPVVHGDRATVIQIAIYTLLTVIVSAIPLFQGEAKLLYLASAAFLNVILVIRTLELVKVPERPQAMRLFKFSMLYLALLFTTIAIDRAGWM